MAEPNPTRINITSIGRPLVRVMYGADETTIEASLSPPAAAEAIGEAMLRFAQSARQDARARAELGELRARGADAPLAYANAVGRMCSEMFGTMIASGLADIDIDLEAWSPSSSYPAAN